MSTNKIEWLRKIKSYIAQADIENGINLLLGLIKTNSKYTNTILQISSRYQNFKRNKQLGLIPIYDISLNIITHNIIDLVSEIESDESSIDFRKSISQEKGSDVQQNFKRNDNQMLPISMDNIHGEKKIRIERQRSLVIEELYKDLAKPVFQQIGKALGTSLGLVNTLILPIEYISQISYQTFKKNLKVFSDKIESLNNDDVVKIPQEISVPILEKLFHVRNEELVNLFTNLLKRSSNKKECHLAHPNFVNIISSISPDEARILNKQKGNPIPVIYPKIVYTTEEKDNRIYNDEERSKIYLTNLENEVDIIFPDNIQLYTENLFCLGIIDSFGVRLPRSFHINDFERLKKVYKKEINYFYSQHTELLGKKEQNPRKEVEFGQFSFTEFGRLFIRACCDEE